MRTTILRSIRATTVPAPARPTSTPFHYSRVTSAFSSTRTYASKKNMSATQGQASPGTASNVVEPATEASSKSAEQEHLKDANQTGPADHSPDTASLQTPVSGSVGSATGQQGEDSDMQQNFKQDPKKSDGEKREQVERQGDRPLDPADK